ncbi:hypothetical protein J5N97_016079 [Dioscorea zingiberensis]|uniref:Uncharacterized protein n=1 Tax=Dioscorea zingiberensis TaxID=325984 RepID=A0A9D5CJK4_9LILI|nr:hypothetical protein J5N97_016079 [Dioscorea zingiberensis]
MQWKELKSSRVERTQEDGEEPIYRCNSRASGLLGVSAASSGMLRRKTSGISTEDLWQAAVFPVGTEWENMDKLSEIKWNFSNLERGALHGKTVYMFGCTEPQLLVVNGEQKVTLIPIVVVVVCDFDWELDECEEFTTELIQNEALPEDKKDVNSWHNGKSRSRKERKHNVRQGKPAKAIDDMDERTKSSRLENMKFYKFYPVQNTRYNPDISEVKVHPFCVLYTVL